jgi:hypothetical protein
MDKKPFSTTAWDERITSVDCSIQIEDEAFEHQIPPDLPLQRERKIYSLFSMLYALSPLRYAVYPKTPPILVPATLLIAKRQTAPRMIRMRPKAAASFAEPPM